MYRRPHTSLYECYTNDVDLVSTNQFIVIIFSRHFEDSELRNERGRVAFHLSDVPVLSSGFALFEHQSK